MLRNTEGRVLDADKDDYTDPKFWLDFTTPWGWDFDDDGRPGTARGAPDFQPYVKLTKNANKRVVADLASDQTYFDDGTGAIGISDGGGWYTKDGGFNSGGGDDVGLYMCDGCTVLGFRLGVRTRGCDWFPRLLLAACF